MSKRNYNPWMVRMVHVKVESNESVSHDHTEPNYLNDVEIKFDIDDVADYLACFCDLENVHSIPNDITPVIANAMAEFIGSLPKDTQDDIADYLRDDDGFKQWLCEHKDIWLPSSRYR